MKLSFRTKLWLTLALVWTSLLMLGTYSAVDARQRLLAERLAALDSVLDIAVNIAQEYRARIKIGDLTEDEAKKRVLHQWSQLRYAQTGYVYAATMSQISLMNPGRPELVGKDASSMQDAYGYYPYPEIIKLAREKRTGYISAYSTKPGTNDVSEKISAVHYVPYWDWVVCAGLYVDDVDKAFREILLAHFIWVTVAGGATSALMALLIRNIHDSLGGDPAYAAEIANLIAEGDLSVAQKMAKGNPGSLLHAMHRMTNYLAASQQFERWSLEDGLTGIANRRCFEQRLSHQLQHAFDDGQTLSVAFIDVDGFKGTNDQFGHAVGDSVLKALATILSAHVREHDLPARLAGDEFVVMFTQANKAMATQIADRVVAAVANFDWETITHGLRVALSIGVAEAKFGDTVDSLLHRSDLSMYSNKRDYDVAHALPTVGAARGIVSKREPGTPIDS
ncbi:diguanylate cyclase [Ralstonia sp. 11b]|jgi:diguanylate cyclase (GGDEF)-like protein|uniref:sensor domain-containing diguanylate cyclase n=1 Tax=Ralstonia sp. 11b TaxID=3063544 RepID=UPI00286FF7A0|nr:diguanylate cyclase [Ralstonia sp. 11b]MDR9384185.1 diguanylate cyclase [Ralstonia sp. 11b]MEA3271684.1 diguanylate cyclase [Pseudomonadota bacterium]